ncbi:hypothetical protein KP77_08570 [Jeotgalibacillus alimentarius]|uniref:Uncharacterized protein n=1 Tax=Jeotgalibacillus alimentarius TaxID=135826 RepID=A0A0C2RM43_9BACL|nr:hypothetical protein [Jeotgalibacillus alimentarius]KIL51345.1 hypothetical protein KP77_08570 [Jeotgalibacillus alimentarius]
MKNTKHFIMINVGLVLAGVLGYYLILNETPKPRIFAVSFLFFFWVITDYVKAHIQKAGASKSMLWLGNLSFLVTSVIGFSIIYLAS